MRRFAISDIHGCLKTFEALLDQIGLSRADELYLLGDYIDRGPNSRGVIDRIWQLQAEGYAVRCLMGNHEQLLLQSAEDPEKFRTWLLNGAWETLYSFQSRLPSQMPAPYLDWFRALSCYFEVDDYILVHAGLSFSTANPLSDTQGMLWVRGWYGDIDYEWLGRRTIVHGHTPIKRSQQLNLLQQVGQYQVINIDGGCVFGSLYSDLGNLCAFDLTNRLFYFQPFLPEPAPQGFNLKKTPD